jgi:hypothetical protein
MAAKLARLTHKIVIQLHLVAKSCTICISRSKRPVRKLLVTPSYSVSRSDGPPVLTNRFHRAFWTHFPILLTVTPRAMNFLQLTIFRFHAKSHSPSEPQQPWNATSEWIIVVWCRIAPLACLSFHSLFRLSSVQSLFCPLFKFLFF